MTLDELFAAYYALYRTEAVTPASTDDEYIIFINLANEAISRWASYDGTYWNQLFDTLQVSGDGDSIITSATTQYAAPDDMKEAGGFVKLLNPNTLTTLKRIPIIEPQDAQFKGDNSLYCYFTGDPNNGFELNINPVPDSNLVGCLIDYVYYKKPTLLAVGADTTEMSEPYFIVHRALANRFRGSRNPYYESAKNDAEDVLKIMQMSNNSGNWADPWSLPDRSGAQFGSTLGNTGGF